MNGKPPYGKSEGNTKWIIIAAVIIIVIIALFYLFTGDFFTQTEEEIEPEEPPIDDRISPDTSQDVIFVIERVVRRGLEDEMRTYGRKVPEPTPYYILLDIDNEIFNTSTVETAQGAGSGLITQWDSGPSFFKVVRGVEEEQEKSNINLQIMEIQTKGLLSNKKEYVVIEQLSFIYDYRTGRWTGDDTFKDRDGYGHFWGEKCEIWFDIQQTDYDRDNIPYWTEVNSLHTDPRSDDSLSDPDMDGVPTTWEWKWGYDPHVWNNHTHLDPDRDGLSNRVEYSLEKWSTNPFHQDIFVEVDGMQSSGKRYDFPSYMLWEESQLMVQDKFSRHNITLHIDDGCMGGGGELVPYAEVTAPESGIFQYYHHNFADERKGIFHYCLISHRAGWTYPQDSGNRYDACSVSGSMDVFREDFGHNNILYSMLNPHLSLFNPRTKYIWIASIFMHEIGHTLGLTPGYMQQYVPDELKENDTGYYCYGIDNQSVKFLVGKTFKEVWENHGEAVVYWADYVSCMNYADDGKILHGLLKPNYSATVLDYSDGTHGSHDSDDWGNIDLTFFQKRAPYSEGYESEEY